MTPEISGAHASGGGTSEGHLGVIMGWDERALLVLAIIFSGWIPLAVGLGVSVGFVSTGPEVQRSFVGLGVAAVALVAPFGLLYVCGTSHWIRQIFIPLARKVFPPSDQMKP